MKSEGFIQMQKSMQACFVDGRMAKVPTQLKEATKFTAQERGEWCRRD